MLNITHITNPVSVPETSDLFKAQPITFRAINFAREFAHKMVDVHLLSAQYPEDRSLIPDNWELTPDLNRSVLDCGQFAIPRKLPLLKDILDRMYTASDAEYFVYSNVDIAPLPHFYLTIKSIIESGFDAFSINRRTIINHDNIENLPLMYAEIGKSHPGHDCFVFRRDTYPNFELGNACLGARFVGRVLIWNLICYSHQFKEFSDLHLTFHLGNDKSWKSSNFQDYAEYNKTEAIDAFEKLKAKNKGFSKDHLIHQYQSRFTPSAHHTRLSNRLQLYWRKFSRTS